MDVRPELAHKQVADVSWEQLSKFEIGSWKGEAFAGHRVPLLDEVFARMRGRPERQIYLDFKEASLPRLASMAEQAGVGEQVFLGSSEYQLLREWIALVPRGRTLLWTSFGGRLDDTPLRSRMGELRAMNFHAVSHLQTHVLPKQPAASIHRDMPDPFVPSDELLRETNEELGAHGVVLQVFLMGEPTEAVYMKLLDLGIRCFATNHPQLLLRVVQRSSIDQTRKNLSETSENLVV